VSRTRKLGLTALILTLLADQGSKLWVLFGLGLQQGGAVDLGPLVTLVYTWNRGISFSLFQQEEALGRWLLTAFMLTAAIALTVWLWRTKASIVAIGLGLIVGGALGNAIDRIAHGAVFDFIRLDLKFFVWPTIFNIADAAIVVGVAFLLYDSLLNERGSAAKSPR
jgi:signal peptidase II